MLQSLLHARLDDHIFGEDQTVNALESLTAEMTGKEAALFVSSGTQSNLLALLGHCARGDEFIAGQDVHVCRFEAGCSTIRLRYLVNDGSAVRTSLTRTCITFCILVGNSATVSYFDSGRMSPDFKT